MPGYPPVGKQVWRFNKGSRDEISLSWNEQRQLIPDYEYLQIYDGWGNASRKERSACTVYYQSLRLLSEIWDGDDSKLSTLLTHYMEFQLFCEGEDSSIGLLLRDPVLGELMPLSTPLAWFKGITSVKKVTNSPWQFVAGNHLYEMLLDFATYGGRETVAAAMELPLTGHKSRYSTVDYLGCEGAFGRTPREMQRAKDIVAALPLSDAQLHWIRLPNKNQDETFLEWVART